MVHVAVIGATGAVGRRLVSELEMISSSVDKLSLFASKRSAGQTLSFRGEQITVQEFDDSSFTDVDYVLMSAGGDFSKEHARSIVSQGCVVIDNSSAWRQDQEVSLIVPEVNGRAIQGDHRPRVISNPNCSTIQLVLSVAPLMETFGVRSLDVSSYQSVSGSGQAGIQDLMQQASACLQGLEIKADHLPKPMAFDVIPAIDRLDASGYCNEEIKIIQETRKILDAPELPVSATTIRVPTFVGHGESVTVTLNQEVTLEQVAQTWGERSYLQVFQASSYEELPTLKTCEGSRQVLIVRPRLPFGAERSSFLTFWNMADNLLVGAATNAVKILQTILG